MSSKLVGLGGELSPRLVPGDHPAAESLTLLDDLAHLLFERFKIFGTERVVDVEVVVKAILDRRADAEFRVRVKLLNGLREHVRGGVPQDRQAVRRLDADRLDEVAVTELNRQVT